MLDEVEQLEQRLRTDEISWEEAFDLFCQQGKPWHSKAWAQKRAELLGSACEQCTSTQPPLVLHHLRPSPTLSECKQKIQQPLWEAYKARFPVQKPPLPVIPREACPKCHSTAIRYHKTISRWQCYGRKRQRTCGYQFESPIQVEGHDPQAVRERSTQWHSDCRHHWETFQAQYRDLIGKEAMLLMLQHRKAYWSFEHVATFCKKCAFLWDKKGLRLCQQCKTHWHALLLAMCDTCRTSAAGIECD